MPNATASAAKIPAVCITIRRDEGDIDQCGRTQVFPGLSCWDDAKAWMLGQSPTFTDYGTDQHTLTVVFADGEVYEGRLEAKADGTDCDVREHVGDWLRFSAGERCPTQWTQEHYDAFLAETGNRAEAAAFLAKYAV